MQRLSALLIGLILLGCSSPPPPPPPRPRLPTFKDEASRPRPALAQVEAGEPAGELQVHVMNVGQGDAILVECPDGEHQLLIDAGELDERYPGSESLFKRYMKAVQSADDPIEVVVVTHEAPDHMGSIPWVLKSYQVDYYVDNGRTSPLKLYQRINRRLQERPPAHYLNVYREEPGTLDIDFCPRSDVGAIVLRPRGFGQSQWADRNSIVVRVDYGEASFLFPGDLEETAEDSLVADDQLSALLDCDFLKVARHGARSSSSEEFLTVVSPKIAAISCGLPKKHLNEYHGSPRRITYERLAAHVKPREGEPGTVTVCDDEHPDYGEEEDESGIFLWIHKPGEWVDYKVAEMIYTTGGKRDLVFASDGLDIWLRGTAE